MYTEALDPALERFLAEFRRIAPAIIDRYFVVDRERRIVDFNRAFFASLPRQHARGLEGKRCYEVFELDICQSACIARSCWQQNRNVRLDEIAGRPAPDGEGDPPAPSQRFIVSAIPITDAAGNPVGALEIQRDVTDEAAVQIKYQEMFETQAAERQRLAEQVRERTGELIAANRRLLEIQKELLAYKRGLKS